MVTLLSRFVARDEPCAARLAALLSNLSRGVRAEPGHVAYEAFRAREEPTVLFVTETWSSREAADGHVARVAADPGAQAAQALLARPIETVTLLAV